VAKTGLTTGSLRSHAASRLRRSDTALRGLILRSSPEFRLLSVAGAAVSTRPRRPVSVKLSEDDVQALKAIAAEKGTGYTTLLRVWIKEKLREERGLRG